MTSIILQLTINSLIAGAIYVLVAVGFSLIYSVNNFIHFAYGATIACGAYMLYFFYNILGLNFALAVILTILFTAFLGYLMNLIIYRQLRKRKTSSSILLIASVGLLILLESLIVVFFGAGIKNIGLFKTADAVEIFGATITPLQIFIVIFSFLLLFAVYVFIKKTKIGKAMRAVSDNKEVAEIVGISAEKIYSWSFFIGSAIAGTASVLIGLEENLSPIMGTNLMIKGFAAAIIGGIGSIRGAFIGAFLLGIVENFGIWFLPSGYKDAIVFILLFIFLIFRPQGILGIKLRKD
ncbi:MAG: branched-chain amino acid ABC transporter permease [Parcubacteria group bacterium]|jgi:branched-chain amino acid transport system permease protein